MSLLDVALECDGCAVTVRVPAAGCVVVDDPVTDEQRVTAHCPTCRRPVEGRPKRDDAAAILAAGALLAIPPPRQPS